VRFVKVHIDACCKTTTKNGIRQILIMPEQARQKKQFFENSTSRTKLCFHCCRRRQKWMTLTLDFSTLYQWCRLRPSVLGQDRSETKKKSVLVSVLVLHAVVLVLLGLGLLVLQAWCWVVKHGLVTLVVIMILKYTETSQVLFIVSLFWSWNITTVKINSGVHLL